jgi:hypothetical protein
MRHCNNKLILLRSSRIISLRSKMIGCTHFFARKKIHFLVSSWTAERIPRVARTTQPLDPAIIFFDEEVPPSLDGDHEALFGNGSLNDLSDEELYCMQVSSLATLQIRISFSPLIRLIPRKMTFRWKVSPIDVTSSLLHSVDQ